MSEQACVQHIRSKSTVSIRLNSSIDVTSIVTSMLVIEERQLFTAFFLTIYSLIRIHPMTCFFFSVIPTSSFSTFCSLVYNFCWCMFYYHLVTSSPIATFHFASDIRISLHRFFLEKTLGAFTIFSINLEIRDE